jgi:hypothetical protein
MADPASAETIRAAVEAVLPPVGDRPGGADLGVHEHVIEQVEMALPGFVGLMAALLDATAMELSQAPFAGLGVAERLEVIRALSSDEAQDVREAADVLLIFAYGGMYSEWTGYDRAAGELRPPAVWDDLGFHGPSLGHPGYREEP